MSTKHQTPGVRVTIREVSVAQDGDRAQSVTHQRIRLDEMSESLLLHQSNEKALLPFCEKKDNYES